MGIFTVGVGRDHLPVMGCGGVLVSPPADIVRLVNGKQRVDIAQLANLVTELTQDAAEEQPDLLLHHAEWSLCTDPETVSKLGNLHDCPGCRANTDQALTYLRENPGRPILGGILYWAGKAT